VELVEPTLRHRLIMSRIKETLDQGLDSTSLTASARPGGSGSGGSARRRLDARDPIKICDQSREQGNKLRGLLVREAAQRLAVTPEQGCNRAWQTRFCGLRHRNAAAASIGRVRHASDETVSLHAGEHLRHRRLLDLGEAGQITLRAGSAVPKRDQYRQMTDAEAQGLQARFAQASEAARRETDQVPGCREHIHVRQISRLHCSTL
jgi:hypothetical protein